MSVGKMEYMGDAAWWDERFRGRTKDLMLPEAKLSADLKYLEDSNKILDLACGDGRNAVYLAKLGYEVCAVDFSAAALDRLRTFAECEGLDIATKLLDIAAKDELLKQEIKADAAIINHYRMAREVYPIVSAWINDGGILWVNGFAEVPEDNPRIREQDLLQDSDFALLAHCTLLDKEEYKVSGRKFVRYIWKK